jgi:hypothetical protein
MNKINIQEVVNQIAEVLMSCEHTVINSDFKIEKPINGKIGVPVSYTVGLTTQNKPELVIFGINDKSAAWVLNQLAHWVKEDKMKLDVAIPNFISGRSVMFKNVREENIETGLPFATAYFTDKLKSVKAIQCFVSDTNNRFPWEEECDSHVSLAQPILY